MALLVSVKSAEFNYIMKKTGATRGNISVQLRKLEEAGYIEIRKSYKNNYPLTSCNVTPAGMIAFENYADALKNYLAPGSDLV